MFEVITNTPLEQIDHMVDWCVVNCEAPWAHHYHAWKQERWVFEDQADAVEFALYWT